MREHGIYVSFAVLLESAALLLGLVLAGLAIAFLYGPALMLLLVLVLITAGMYGWQLWSMRGGHSYGLWALEGTEEEEWP